MNNNTFSFEQEKTLKLLIAVRDGSVSPEEALSKLATEPYDDLGFAKLDLNRTLRQGFPEVIFGQGKTPEQIIAILRRMKQNGMSDILVTRVKDEAVQAMREAGIEFNHSHITRLAVCFPNTDRKSIGNVAVVSAGTSDMPVCEEAAITLETMGSHVERVYDAGVAGLHRLLSKLEILRQARVIIAVAGMEGALVSVVGGLVACPVIAVPTSVGYGANMGGVSTLLSMLNSCASGVSVVNIDNGFGAAVLAHRINTMRGIED
ncbi:MAG: nickel pincer cofactor biosynthesis protein LarB [Oscillospiraceae bacterium]|jgi:NCAIR mutase (PurE)-related protein|nr:nickel pincer cofactor biosynthesis protein LarB [Oscillospiraceae bacterium]